MKKNKLTYSLVLCMVLSICRVLNADDLIAGTMNERLQACTDRTTFAAGEQVFFSVVVFNDSDSASAGLSQAFYCELITPRGTQVTGRKYLLHNSRGKGSLTIPEETVSGIFYLKFYTRFMRNGGTDTYKYIMLKIINPYKPDVLSGNDVLDTAGQAARSAALSAGGLRPEFRDDTRNFKSREEISFKVTPNEAGNAISRVCVSVMPSATWFEPVLPHAIPVKDTGNAVYYPETRGITLTGQLIEKESKKPVRGARVNLSIIGDKDILVMRTDTAGRFFFTLPDYYGKMDVFLSADELPDIKPELLIDNDFCSRPVSLASPPFILTDEERAAAYKLAVNSRVSAVFRQDTLRYDSLAEGNKNSFYGKPSEILQMSKFIDLPTLTEYFTELPGMVKLKKIKGKKQFRFYDAIDEMSMYPPLMLVDWVAVNDIEKILSMAPGEIDRIELVGSLYIKGNITYGGIISFVSKKNNFAGIDLPTSGTFVNYRFLEEPSASLHAAPVSLNIPDARNTLYWDPDLAFSPEGTATVTFMAPDTPGDYWILLRKMMKNGSVVTSREMITVAKPEK